MANELIPAKEMGSRLMDLFDRACEEADLNEQEKAEAFKLACEWLSNQLFDRPMSR